MKKNIFWYLSNGSLIIGAAIGAYVFIDIYLLKGKLRTGICPVTSNRPFLYIAIALCCISFIFSFFEPKAKNKKDDN